MSEWLPALNGAANAWADAILRASWQGGLALAAVWLLCRCVPRLSPGAQCWLWRLAILKLLAALVWAAPVGLPVLPAPAPDAPPADAPRPVAIHEPAAPVRGAVPATRGDLGPAAWPAPAGSERPAPASLLFAIWLAALGLWAARTAGEARTARRLRREAEPVRQGWLLEDTARLCRRLGIRRPPQVRLGRRLTTPVLTGILAPAVVFPPELLARTTRAEARSLLAHELAHLKRRDLWWNLLATAAHGIFLFHPLVWLAGKEARLAQEMACDDSALEVTAAAATEYGEALLKVAAAGGPRPLAGVAAVAVVESYASLKRRITAIRGFQPGARRGGASFAALPIALVGIAVVPWQLVPQPPAAPRFSGENSIAFPTPPTPVRPIQVLPAGNGPQRRTGTLRSVPPPAATGYALSDNRRPGSNLPAPERRPPGVEGATGAEPALPPAVGTQQVAQPAAAGGRRILFSSNRGGTYDLYLVDPDTGATEPLVKEGKTGGQAAWSPDGKQIAYILRQRTGTHDVFVMNADGSNVRQLTDDPADDQAPTWSPDGKKIAFVSRRDPDNRNADIYVMNVDGSEQTRITDWRFYDGEPAWSPDGRSILFSSNRDGGQISLFLMDPDGKNVRMLLAKQSRIGPGYPAWSPDGKQIAYCDQVGEAVELFVCDAGGRNPRRVSTLGGTNSFPSWSPDGKWIAIQHWEQQDQPGALWVVHVTDGIQSNLGHTGSFPVGRPTWKRP